MQPRRTLSSKQLTLFMAVLILGPVSCGLLLFMFTKRTPEPMLPALVKLDTMWIVPQGDKNNQRLVPCISIKNPSQDTWKNLSVGINEQFYCQEPKGIQPGETVSLPLEVFVVRNGSMKFPVGNREVQRATIFAQIPSGARAVSEHDLSLESNAKPPDGEKDDNWTVGVSKAEFMARKKQKGSKP